MSDEAGADALGHVVFTSRPSSRDLIVNAAAMGRASGFMLAFGTFLTVSSVASLLAADQRPGVLTVVNVVTFLLGLSFLSGAIVVPFIWWMIRRRGDLLLAPVDVDADDEGIRVSAAYATSQQSWTVYRSARETSHAFTLDTGTGAAALLTKRGVSAADIDAFRALLRRVGLLQAKHGVRTAIRPLLWVGLGLALAAALSVGPRFLANIGATATMDLVASVQDGRVTVAGTTDLPDGAIVSIQVLQLDEWERASGSGVEPDIDSWPYADYDEATVSDGRFSESFAVDDWPSGRGVAVAYFWVDPMQPAAVIEKFGRDGEGLKGPDVTGDDFGSTLEVQRVFQLP